MDDCPACRGRGWKYSRSHRELVIGTDTRNSGPGPALLSFVRWLRPCRLRGAVLTGAERAEVTAAVKRLNDLAAELDRRGFAARVLASGGKLRMWVQNRSISHLSDAVYAAPDGDGAWWLWWSWADQIAPIDDVSEAAFKIAYVLTPA